MGVRFNLKKIAIACLPAFVFAASACTPEQLDMYEQITGQTLSQEIRQNLISLPDEPIRLPDGREIKADGSITREMRAPAGSRCPQFYDEAMAAGWPASSWSRIDYIMFRESRCTPSAYNGKGRDNSYGLTQLNMKALKSWVGPMVNWDFTRLYDPHTNLVVARELFNKARSMWGCGWRPWAFRC